MRSITYDGHSFGDCVSAELVEPVAHVIAPETARVPGRPGRVLLSADVEPLELKVRLFLDAPDTLTSARRSELRRTLRSWLLNTDSSVLECRANRTWNGMTWSARGSRTGACSSPTARRP